MKTLKKAAIAILILFATFAYWEACVRLFARNDFWSILDRDPDIRTIHKKNYAGYVWNEESNRYVYLKTDSRGFIGDEYSLAKPQDTIRIAFLGNSMVESINVDYYASFEKQLEAALNASGLCGKRFEVSNYGIGGKSTFENYQVYKKFVAETQPDFVVLGFMNFDVENQLTPSDINNYHPKYAFLKSLVYKSELAKLFVKEFANLPGLLQIMDKANIIKAKATIAATVDNVPAVNPAAIVDPTTSLAPMAEYPARIIEQLNQEASSSQSKLFVMFFPPPTKDLTTNNPEMIQVTKGLIKHLESQKIATIYPDTYFDAASHELGQCLYTNCSGHLNATGQLELAKYLRQYFAAKISANGKICK